MVEAWIYQGSFANATNIQEKLKLREENEKLHSKLIESRNKCNEITKEKTELARFVSCYCSFQAILHCIHSLFALDELCCIFIAIKILNNTVILKHSALITSEEERLRISKSLIDLQIENNRVREEAEAKSFDDVCMCVHICLYVRKHVYV